MSEIITNFVSNTIADKIPTVWFAGYYAAVRDHGIEIPGPPGDNGERSQLGAKAVASYSEWKKSKEAKRILG
jgi:hypothetical protein